MEFYSQFPLRRSRLQSYRDPPRLKSVNQDFKSQQKSLILKTTLPTECGIRMNLSAAKDNCHQEFLVKLKPRTSRAFSLVLNQFPQGMANTKQHQILHIQSFPQGNPIKKTQFAAPETLFTNEDFSDKYFKDLRTYFNIKYENPNQKQKQRTIRCPDISKQISIKAWDIEDHSTL